MSVKKMRQEEKLTPKSIGTHSKASRDLRRLQSLLAKNSPRQEVAVLSHSKGCSSGGSRSIPPQKNTSRHRRESDISNEASELDKFSITYRDQRCFSSHPLHELFSGILVSLIKNRLCSEWIEHAPPESVLRVLICLRLLIRDPHYQKILHELQGISLLARYMESVTALCMSCGEQAFATQKLVTMTYIFQKLSATQHQRVWVIESGAHRTMAKLLSTTDSSVLLGALLALTTLAESIKFKEEIGKLLIVESLLVILQEYDLLSKRMSAELLRLLCPVQIIRAQVRELDGLPVLLSLLHGQHLKLLWSVTWVLVQLCEDPDIRVEIRSWGGVQQLLRLLDSDRQYISDRSSIEALSSANAAGRIQREHMREELSPQEVVDNMIALQSACCTALTELSLDDTSAHHIVQENGIYIIAKLIIPCDSGETITSLQCYAFRALRFLFSVERNRHLFKRLFPTDLFELFIDVGHYVRDLAAYEGLQTKVSLYTKEELDNLREGFETVDQNRPPLRVISGYSILDHLGTGAFGSVFKVQKQSGQNILALKEVNLHNPAFGKDKKSRDSNVEKIISELTIIKEQMTHPNIVKYYRTFLEGDKLYIVMELIEGVSLGEHFNSLKEKQQQFTEDRLWNIFIQMCLALRYLHKEKRIVHRDLTPNNIMLGEKDKVTITDFGLAKQKEENSKLTSVVGTILYSCPEIVKNEPYGEKADIWALGCILYQMATLQPPFYSSNMLSLASKIVEADYEPIEEGTFSERVIYMIKWCLSPDPDLRPDIIAVSSRISDLMMKLMDGLYTSQNSLERKAERDRKRAQKFFLERDKIRATCSHSNMSQETPLMKTEYAPSCSSTACSSNHSREQRLTQGDSPDEDLETSQGTDTTTNSTGKHYALIKGSKSAACATPDHILVSGDFAAVKVKPRPVSAGICVSQKKLRQIDDPIQRLLVQLHKIIFITQLPPAPHHNIKRRLVERFKKSLFQFGSDPYNLKVELSKLLQASPELLAFGLISSDWWPLIHHFTGDIHTTDSTVDVNLRDGVTYHQMQGIIEELLNENSYYEPTNSRLKKKRNDQEKK
ncbi:serine/threonine-protein kinase Nek10 isoform X1 [Oreochromis niloticus]|uniref:Serine/threonine-protein kinase Nek10 n=3 Tax=Oreochromis niloticus TaxID=8128 RepID=I3JH46_ORENI|nr:serine/threonine-protein kinase Nek10 isoform X1 [Oreochromis niloticus]XP_005455166.1 serine/threonine-protein kinase Nek10 isoform X1 [Oreochromis niloticus]